MNEELEEKPEPAEGGAGGSVVVWGHFAVMWSICPLIEATHFRPEC